MLIRPTSAIFVLFLFLFATPAKSMDPDQAMSLHMFLQLSTMIMQSLSADENKSPKYFFETKGGIKILNDKYVIPNWKQTLANEDCEVAHSSLSQLKAACEEDTLDPYTQESFQSSVAQATPKNPYYAAVISTIDPNTQKKIFHTVDAHSIMEQVEVHTNCKNPINRYPIETIQVYRITQPLDQGPPKTIELDKSEFDRIRERNKAFLQTAKNGNADGVLLFLEANTSPDVHTEDGNTALHTLATSNLEESVVDAIYTHLHSHGATHTTCNNSGGTPLNGASLKGNLPLVRRLLEHAPSTLDVTDSDGDTPLLSAIISKNEEVALELVSRGADCSIQNKTGRTPLLIAAVKNKLKIAQAIVEKHPEALNFSASNEESIAPVYPRLYVMMPRIMQDSILKQDNEHQLPLDLARTNGCEYMVSILEPLTLHAAVTTNNLALVQELVEEKQVDPNLTHDGFTLFAYACRQENTMDIAQFLAPQPTVDVNIVIGKSGRTPLMRAALYGKENMLNALLCKCAPVDQQDSLGFTALDFAIAKAQKSSAKILIRCGADLHAVHPQSKAKLAKNQPLNDELESFFEGVKRLTACLQAPQAS